MLLCLGAGGELPTAAAIVRYLSVCTSREQHRNCLPPGCLTQGPEAGLALEERTCGRTPALPSLLRLEGLYHFPPVVYLRRPALGTLGQ